MDRALDGTPMTKMGVIHGRFQVLHNDHLKYLMEGKARCEHLVVGITNPDPFLTREDATDPHRSTPLANPLTYFERCVMVRTVLTDAAVDPRHFTVVPFPINLPELYPHYLPMDAVFYLTIYDQWGERKLEQFRSLHLKTEVLWTRTPDTKGLSATDIRRRMAAREPWEALVPPAVASLMKSWSIPERIRRLAAAPL